MKHEFRWAKHASVFAGEIVVNRVLQYRYQVEVRPKDSREWRDDYRVKAWTDWTIVPETDEWVK